MLEKEKRDLQKTCDTEFQMKRELRDKLYALQRIIEREARNGKIILRYPKAREGKNIIDLVTIQLVYYCFLTIGEKQ